MTGRSTVAGALVALGAVGLLAGCAGAMSVAQVPATASSTMPPNQNATAGPTAPAQVEPKGRLLGPFPVARVVDGDTIRVATDDGEVRVRLIGIDTPETVSPNEPVGCFGPEASAQAERLLAGTSVYLELDASQGDTDRFGRVLAYAWQDEHTMFNYAMVRDGFATEYTYDAPYAYQREFRSAQAGARAAGLGLWSAATCNGRP